MIESAESEVVEIGTRLLDDAYLAWFSAESDCERALHTWFEGSGANYAMPYFAYRAALDREEAAARDLQRLWELAGPRRESLVHGDEGVLK